jgi:hypothetical protein
MRKYSFWPETVGISFLTYLNPTPWADRFVDIALNDKALDLLFFF